MTHLINDVYAVEIPDDCKEVKIENDFILCKESKFDIWNGSRLPSFDYELLFLSSEATEGDWRGIVERKVMTGVKFRDEQDYKRKYYVNYTDEFSVCTSHIQSGLSLLKSKGITGNAAILRQVKK